MPTSISARGGSAGTFTHSTPVGTFQISPSYTLAEGDTADVQFGIATMTSLGGGAQTAFAFDNVGKTDITLEAGIYEYSLWVAFRGGDGSAPDSLAQLQLFIGDSSHGLTLLTGALVGASINQGITNTDLTESVLVAGTLRAVEGAVLSFNLSAVGHDVHVDNVWAKVIQLQAGAL